jgi:hypothetical protein
VGRIVGLRQVNPLAAEQRLESVGMFFRPEAPTNAVFVFREFAMPTKIKRTAIIEHCRHRRAKAASAARQLDLMQPLRRGPSPS